jgi:hypothetical protein
MSGLEYPKIDTLYDRNGRYINVGKLRRKEFGNIKRWSITEKIHGINTRITLFDNGEVIYGGRTDDAIMPSELLEYLKKIFAPEKMKEIFWLPDKSIPESVTAYGEGYGPKIVPGSGAYRKDVSFRLFDCLIKGDTGNWWLERQDLEDIAMKLGIKCVPILGIIDFLPVDSLQMLKIFQDNKNRLVAIEEDGMVGMVPEGIIAKTEPLLSNRKGERVMWKLKIKDFKPDILIDKNLKWKSEHKENIFEYKLVHEDNDDEVIGSVEVIEDISTGDITVIAECEKIGYKYVEEHSDKKTLKIMVTNLKKFIKEEFEKIDKKK